LPFFLISTYRSKLRRYSITFNESNIVTVPKIDIVGTITTPRNLNKYIIKVNVIDGSIIDININNVIIPNLRNNNSRITEVRRKMRLALRKLSIFTS
jgi:hypothetical protein